MYIFRAQMGSHMLTLRPEYILYRYMDYFKKGGVHDSQTHEHGVSNIRGLRFWEDCLGTNMCRV